MVDYQIKVTDVDEVTRLFEVSGALDAKSMADVNSQITSWLNSRADQSLGKGDIIVDVRGLTDYPSLKQSIKLGTEVTGHQLLWFVAVVGVAGPIKAIFDWLHIFGGNRFQFFNTVEEAKAFLVKNKRRRPK
jgi:hypothetical protein